MTPEEKAREIMEPFANYYVIIKDLQDQLEASVAQVLREWEGDLREKAREQYELGLDRGHSAGEMEAFARIEAVVGRELDKTFNSNIEISFYKRSAPPFAISSRGKKYWGSTLREALEKAEEAK